MGGGSTGSLRRASAYFDGAMPTGMAVARGGWIFVNFPKWGDDVQFTVADAVGNIYAPNFEHNAVLRRRPDGQWETVARNPQLLWTDTMLVAADGYPYVTANQLNRQPPYQGGEGLRQKPYVRCSGSTSARDL